MGKLLRFIYKRPAGLNVGPTYPTLHVPDAANILDSVNNAFFFSFIPTFPCYFAIIIMIFFFNLVHKCEKKRGMV